MASGYKDFNVTSDGLIKIRFSWNTGTPNITNNFTPLNWLIQIISTSSSANISSSAAKDYEVTIDGQTWTGTNSVAVNGGVTRTLVSGVKNIYHDDDGTKEFNYSFSQEFAITYSGASIGTITGSGSGTLDDIPRASVLGDIANFTIGNAITIPITKYSTSFSDTLNIYVGNTWIKRVERLINNQNVTFTSTELNNIYTAMSNVTNATFRFVNSTYSGANVIGISTKTATGTITSTIKPTISSVTIEEIVSDIETQFGFLVQNKSMLGVTINAVGGTGSSIESYDVSINGTKYISSTFTTEVLKTSGTNTYSVTVTDKRGRSASTSGTFSVTAYTSPTISKLSVVRCNADGTLNDEGTYAKVNANAVITSLSNKNTKSFKLQYKPKTSNTWTTDYTYTDGYTLTITDRIIANISNDYPYDFRILASDFFETDVKREYPLSAGQPILDIKADGKGIAFFKVSNKQGIENGKDTFDRFDTMFRNGLSAYQSSSDPIDADTTIEELFLTTLNTPDTSFWYVKQMFYGAKTPTSNRTQIAYPYNKKLPTYCRYYINGTGWSEWFASDIKEMDISDYNGYVWFGNGLLHQWGRVSITPVAANTVTNITVNFPKAFDNIPDVKKEVMVSYPNIVTSSAGNGTTVDIAKRSMIIYMTRTNTVATNFQWSAKGYKAVI